MYQEQDNLDFDEFNKELQQLGIQKKTKEQKIKNFHFDLKKQGPNQPNLPPSEADEPVKEENG